MKNFVIFFILLLCCNNSIYAQMEAAISCNNNADELPGKYYNHTQSKYPINLKASSAQEKTAMTNELITLEKLEEKSRNGFTNTGCVLRSSFSNIAGGIFDGYLKTAYSYQLAAYQNVCHATQHIIKTVDEYRTVLRVNINPNLTEGNYYGERGDFYITDKKVRYEIAIDAKRGVNYDKERISNRSRIAQYISEAMVLANRSDEKEDLKHNDFLKIINGSDYVENWPAGGWRYDKTPGKYRWIDRHYFITQPGIPLLIPVTRKEYLEALLEYYEIEKANFMWTVSDKIKSNSKDGSIYEADKTAYQKIYENKKAKVQQLLSTQKPDWLQKPAVVSADRSPRSNDYNKPSNGLFDFDKFYDDDKRGNVLYQYNPAYFKTNANEPAKPVFIELQFRYEIGDDRGFSERLFNNFLKNYDVNALRKML